MTNYLGFGAGASGFVENYRYVNYEDVTKYITAVNKFEDAFTATILSNNEKKSEFVFLGLRKSTGVSISKYKNLFNSNILSDFENTIKKYINNGFLKIEKDYLKLSTKAFFVSNTIFSDFLL